MEKADRFTWKEVLFDSSKKQVIVGISICEKYPEQFPALFELAMEQSGKYSQRAARIVSYLLIKPGTLFPEYIDIVLNKLDTIHDESIKFCFLHIFTECDLPDDDEKLGILTKICFDSVEAKVQRIAIKVYSIDILYRISEIVPEIKPEVFYIINKYMQDAPMSYTSRGFKILNKLRKQIGVIDEEEYY